MMRKRLATVLLVWLAVFLGAAPGGHAQATGRPPTGKKLTRLVESYLDADETKRKKIRDEIDAEIRPLRAYEVKRLRKDMLKAAKRGPKIELSGTHYLYQDGEQARGKYIARGPQGAKTLFLGLHGGGVGSGDAESMAAGMGGGGWFWIFPEVLEKTERGWTDAGTDRFVLELIQAAKRTLDIDPNRVYVTGHSMGGYGAWTLGAHHSDVFAGAASYAGGPSPIYTGPDMKTVLELEQGILPNYHNLPLLFYQSLDDAWVTPEVSIFANKELLQWKERHPSGFHFRYLEVTGRNHDPPAEGYLPSQQWVASHDRVPRPKKFLWQTVLDWKHHYYWLYLEKPAHGTLFQVEAKEDNVIDVQVLDGARDFEGLSVLLGEPLVDLSKEVTIHFDGQEVFRGEVEPTLSTLLMTLPRRDEALLYSARVDLAVPDSAPAEEKSQ